MLKVYHDCFLTRSFQIFIQTYHPIKCYITYVLIGKVVHSFLTSALDGCEWSVPCLGHFIPGETAVGTHWIGSWVGGLRRWSARGVYAPVRNQTLFVHLSSPVTVLTELSRLTV
jgi:hypothetical protein